MSGHADPGGGECMLLGILARSRRDACCRCARRCCFRSVSAGSASRRWRRPNGPGRKRARRRCARRRRRPPKGLEGWRSLPAESGTRAQREHGEGLMFPSVIRHLVRSESAIRALVCDEENADGSDERAIRAAAPAHYNQTPRRRWRKGRVPARGASVLRWRWACGCESRDPFAASKIS